jgi:hypothetical protein
MIYVAYVVEIVNIKAIEVVLSIKDSRLVALGDR